jgi:transcriptional regulator with XRE-family HTH domain
MFDEKLAQALVEEGFGKAQIAAKLGVSYSTVANNLKVKKSAVRKTCSKDHVRFGARVSELMVDKNYGVKLLSEKSGLHIAVISRILTGSQDVRFSEMIRLAEALGVDLKKLF